MRASPFLVLGLVITASLVRGDEKEDAAVKFVENAGGKVTRDERTRGKPVIAVKLKEGKVTDADMKVIAGLKHLRELNLNLNFLPIGATGLRELKVLKDLRLLELALSGVKEGDYKALGELTQLEVLNLWGTTISDEDLKELAGLKDLTDLRLTLTPISDKGLKHLAAFKKLQVLDLSGTQLGDPGVTDAGLKELIVLKQLRVLMLEETLITDEGLKVLAELKQLKKVTLSKSKATEAGVEKLKMSLPDCEVVYKK